MNIEQIAKYCLESVLDGTRITLSLKKGAKWPKGWPRGELMSETIHGKNVSFDPIKILAFLQRHIRSTEYAKDKEHDIDGV